MYCSALPCWAGAPREAGSAAGSCASHVDVDRLRDGEDLDRGQPADDVAERLALADAEAQRDAAGGRAEALILDQRQAEPAYRLLQLLDRHVGGDLQQHLVLDEARLGERRNVEDSPLEAGREIRIGGNRALRLLRRPRRRRRQRRHVDDRVGVERGELNVLDQILDDLRLRQRPHDCVCVGVIGHDPGRERRNERVLREQIGVGGPGLNAPDRGIESGRERADEFARRQAGAGGAGSLAGGVDVPIGVGDPRGSGRVVDRDQSSQIAAGAAADAPGRVELVDQPVVDRDPAGDDAVRTAGDRAERIGL